MQLSAQTAKNDIKSLLLKKKGIDRSVLKGGEVTKSFDMSSICFTDWQWTKGIRTKVAKRNAHSDTGINLP